MAKRDPRVDAYIAKAPQFAKPVLTHIRKVIHSAIPEVEESIKWSAPAFEYKGMIGIMASFKEYCAMNLWKGPLILKHGDKAVDDPAGNFGKLRTVDDLPSDKVLEGYFKQAAKLNEEGISVKKKSTAKKKPPTIPPALASALAKNAKARAAFDAFSPSHQREYIEWITEAKTEETRQRRLETALEWMAEGKSRNWKYARR
jgi:uncharacterized protein YdeI (YjbR/CyaY-like superfamily)